MHVDTYNFLKWLADDEEHCFLTEDWDKHYMEILEALYIIYAGAEWY